MSNQRAESRPPRVLLISYYFPPAGGPGVQRVLKFTKYLPSQGFVPVVLTVPEDAEYPLRDPSLAAEVPAEARVVRSPIREFYRAYRAAAAPAAGARENLVTTAAHGGGARERFLRWVRGAVFIPDGRMGWLPGGVRVGRATCRTEDCRLIFASGPPFTAHWIGRRLAEQTGRPLVLDFRDPWTQAPFYPARPRWARRLDERLEHSCLRRAAAVVTVNDQIRRDLLDRYPDLDPRKFDRIPNGWDPDDFEGIERTPAPEWTLTHTGTLPAGRFPPGFAPGLARFLDEAPEAAGRLRVRLIGHADPRLYSELLRPPLDRVVRFEPYAPHRESVRALCSSRLLLLFIEEGPAARGILTGKLFEYLGSGVPILAIAPDGEAAELLRAVGGARVVGGGDADGVTAALHEAAAALRRNERPFGEPDRAAVMETTRPAQTARLAAVFRRVIAAPLVPEGLPY